MKISKVLNNNAVVVIDRDGQEKVAIGAGIAFQKKKNDIVNPNRIQKLFVMKENEKLQLLLSRIPEEHFTISEEIITFAEEYIGSKLNEHIHIALTDHLSFAIERVRDGIHLKNKLLNEIKVLYDKEFEIGLWAIRHMKKRLHIEMPVDEAAYIALHIHTMKLQGGDLRQTVRQATLVRDMVQMILEFLNISDIKVDDISYQRLITHLRFALERAGNNEIHTMDDEMLEMIKKKFPISYQCAMNMAKKLSVNGVSLPEHELGYITLHIERLRKQ